MAFGIFPDCAAYPPTFILISKGNISLDSVVNRRVPVERYVSLTSDLMERLGNMICRLMHDQITRPVQGHYTCLKCMRQHDVNF